MKRGLQVSRTVYIKNLNPLQFVFAVLAYAMGAGLADFLGENIDWDSYWIGQTIVILLIIFSNFLKGYFDFFDPKEYSRVYKDLLESDPSGTVVRHTSAALLITALTALTGAVGMTVIAETKVNLGYPSVIILGLLLFAALFYASPPLRLVYSGYGELVQAILITNLIPALALLFQTNHLHRILSMVSFPVTSLYLAMMIALSINEYGADIKHERSTLLSKMGWRKGMFLHNVLALLAYLLIGLALFFGLPWGLAWPFLLTFPMALFQIWLITSIQGGSTPRWALLKLSSNALTMLSLYLVTFSLWVG